MSQHVVELAAGEPLVTHEQIEIGEITCDSRKRDQKHAPRLRAQATRLWQSRVRERLSCDQPDESVREIVHSIKCDRHVSCWHDRSSQTETCNGKEIREARGS